MALSFTVGVQAESIIQSVTAKINPEVKLSFDNKVVELKDANDKDIPILIYEGSSYLPVRNIAQLADVEVDWDNATKTIQLFKESSNPKYTSILDMKKDDLVKLGYFGDSAPYHPENKARYINDPSKLTTKDGKKLGAGLIIDDLSTAHKFLLDFNGDEADFDTQTIVLNGEYKKMKCYIKVKNNGVMDWTKTYLTTKVHVYDVDNEVAIGSYDFSDFRIKKNGESDFIPFEVDVTGVENLALCVTQEIGRVESEFIFADLKFEK